ncbi:hypothetical protein CQ010_01640 [Arthrobacter sp. MYb211]|uniref:DUF5671 domain-containing protein n=1 Tax=unclassified Arthrobacter TaxID=235627 RepID=UPI000CFC4890|nr:MULTISPECIES: DUF5671 domain-containing protein [unclassified Arthrobacter]PRA13375.1 hypothetical protein CQ015_03895 [Arthrobacter sp. MYb221]PRC10572.1 hypothetical protein CQ010_01640 [Arthrobacter sp. MYb211]
MSNPTTQRPNHAVAGQTVTSLRQLILHGLLFILLMVLGSGLSTLISMLLRGFVPAYSGSTELAVGLSFTLIAGPLTWLLWRTVRKNLQQVNPVDAAIWSLQAAAVYVLALAMSSISFLRLFAELVDPRNGTGWQSLLGAGLGWGLVFVWQYRLINSPKYAPTELPSLAPALGSAYALVLAGISSVYLVQRAVSELLSPQEILLGAPTALPQLLAAAVWTFGALLLWWWHWTVQRVHSMVDDFTDFGYVIIGISLPAVFSLLCAAGLLSLLLPLPVGSDTWVEDLTIDGPPLIAGLLVSLIVWIYHQAKLNTRGTWSAEVSRQIVSGAALAIGASGLGMVINALLASLAVPFSTGTSASVLRAGIAFLVVGALAWVFFFRPMAPAKPASRRVYLVMFFGCSALVALISLLVVGYRIFEFLLVSTGSGSLLEMIRAPFGWLVATALVATYHFFLWRSDRQLLSSVSSENLPAAEIARSLMIVAPQGSDYLLEGLRQLKHIQLHWVPCTGTAPAQDALDQLLTEVSTRIDSEASGLLVTVDSSGKAQFVSLA